MGDRCIAVFRPPSSIVDVDDRLKRLMHTMLAPSLGQHFEFDVGGFAAITSVVSLNRLHLGQVQRKAAIFADGKQLGCIGLHE